MTYTPTEQDYQDHLDETYDLESLGWQGLPFSILLKRGDPVAYWTGYNDWKALQPAEVTASAHS